MDLSKHLEKAAEAVKRRNYPFAVNLYTQLLALQPDNGDARAGLRRALFKRAETKKPSKVFAMIGGGVHLLVGRVSSMLRKPAAAAKSYERYLALDPLDEGANLRLAGELEKAGFNRSALAVYRSYAEQEPRCLVASRRAGILLYEEGDHQAAVAMLEQALKIDPRDQESLRTRKNLAAEGALKSSGLAEAGSSRDLLKDKEAHRKVEKSARLQLTEEEVEAELGELEARVADQPADRATLMRMAELHEMRRDPQSALDCLEQALRENPDDSDLASRVGDLRLSQQEERVRQARARGDESAAELAQKALAEARVGEFRRRVEHHPTDLSGRFALGSALFETGQLDEAIAELQQAVKDPRKKVDALILLGRAFRGKDLADLAKTQLVKALEAGGGPTGKRGLEILYELGSVAEEAGLTADALQHYSGILEQDIGYQDVAQKVEHLKARP